MRPAEGGDRITLRGLRAYGYHGVYDAERERGQEFVVDVVLELDLAPAAASDDVADTVHYGELADRLVAIVAGEPVRLLETLAQRLADACLADPRVRAVEVTVHKPAAPIPHAFTDVSVTLRRSAPASAARPEASGSASGWPGPEDRTTTGGRPITGEQPTAGEQS